MHTYLLRHGEAADLAPDGGFRDDQRELTGKGIKKLHLACKSYARLMVPPDRILHSPLARARQTAEILAGHTGFEGEMACNDGLTPSANPAATVDILQGELLDGVEAVALVGHQPHLGDLLGLLLFGNARAGLPLGQGMLAAVELNDPKVMLGRLLWILPQHAGKQLG
ncbi:MAG: phosphohistidine phosphatase SixA [Planctomycetota bacterium]|jgi:phosphohistidine phosphatase